jgi:hypothetical protein
MRIYAVFRPESTDDDVRCNSVCYKVRLAYQKKTMRRNSLALGTVSTDRKRG